MEHGSGRELEEISGKKMLIKEENSEEIDVSYVVEKPTSSEHAEFSIDVSFPMRSMYFKVTVLSKEDPVKTKKMLMKIVANIKKEVKQEEDHSGEEDRPQIIDEIKLEDANDSIIEISSDEDETAQAVEDKISHNFSRSGRGLEEISGEQMLRKEENSEEIDVSYDLFRTAVKLENDGETVSEEATWPKKTIKQKENAVDIDLPCVTIKEELSPIKKSRLGECKVPKNQPTEGVGPSLAKIKKEESDEDNDEEQPPLKRMKKEEVEIPKEEKAEEHEDGLGESSDASAETPPPVHEVDVLRTITINFVIDSLSRWMQLNRNGSYAGVPIFQVRSRDRKKMWYCRYTIRQQFDSGIYNARRRRAFVEPMRPMKRGLTFVYVEITFFREILYFKAVPTNELSSRQIPIWKLVRHDQRRLQQAVDQFKQNLLF